MRERGACVPADANSKMQGDIAEGFNDLLQSVDALRAENAGLNNAVKVLKAENARLAFASGANHFTTTTLDGKTSSTLVFVCKVRPTDKGDEICDEKRAKEDAENK